MWIALSDQLGDTPTYPSAFGNALLPAFSTGGNPLAKRRPIMRYPSIILLSSFTVTVGAIGSCGSDDTTGSPTSSAATGGGGSASTTITGGGAGATGGSSSTTGGGRGGSAGGGTAGGAGAAGSSGGSAQDSGTDTGASDARVDPPRADGEAGPNAARAVANIMPLPGGTITGTATFTSSGADVTIVMALTNCPEGIHPMHIHAGTGCGSDQEQGVHWDPPRGENIGSGTGQITCLADGTATLTYTRLGSDPTPWTIGGAPATNVIGHPLIVHGPGVTATVRHGCGVITLQ
jgi:Cu/Zn superoxide dismutase